MEELNYLDLKYLDEVCFVCKEKPSDPGSAIRVRLERKRMVSFKTERTETKDVLVPRCRRCRSIEKSENRKNARTVAPAMVAGIAVLLLGIYLKQPEWVPIVACFSVAIGIFAVGIVLDLKQRSKLPEAEQALILKAATPTVDTYPAVAQLLSQDFKVIGRWSERK